MGLSGCYGVIKYLVVLVNLIFWIAGFASIILAIWMLVDRTFYVSMAQDISSYSISAYMLLIVGILLVIVAFLGTCGSLKESQCLLTSFAALLFVILVAEIAATIWAYMYANELEPTVRSYVKSTVQEEYWHNTDRQHTFDMIQRELKCCGTETPRDWIEDKDVILTVSSQNADNYLIPASCCRETVAPALCDHARKQIVAGTIDYTVINDTGCVTKVANYIRDNLWVIIGIGLGIIVMQGFGLIFALILTFAIGKNRRYKA
ncbi:hypothetical protein Trydic_g6643 [Trypoxylus dichotomus]